MNNKLVIDPQIDKLFDIAKLFRQNGYEAQTQQWSESWFAGMNDSLVDAKGNPKQVFHISCQHGDCRTYCNLML